MFLVLPPLHFITYKIDRHETKNLKPIQGEVVCKFISCDYSFITLILMTNLFLKHQMLQGEFWCWSLSGLKGLKGNEKMLGLAEFTIISMTNFDLWRGIRNNAIKSSLFDRITGIATQIVHVFNTVTIAKVNANGMIF